MATQPTFDLQAHSWHSDGELAPSEVVIRAAEAGVALLALTDHDTVAGVAEARRAASGLSLELVAATELSAVDQGGQDLHILGYGLDHTDATLARRLADFRADRRRRGEVMGAALRALGFELDDTEIAERRRTGATVGRPHLAQAVMACASNRPRLDEEQITDPESFLEAYLIEGRAAFRPREYPSVAEAVNAIHDAGGLAVWAHPFWDVAEPARVLADIDRFRALGLDGVEAFYVTHTREQTQLLADRCEALGLLSTGSSDFHGTGHRMFSRFRAHELYGCSARLGSIGTGA